VRLRAQELAPRRSGSTRCRIDPSSVEDRPDGGGADVVAESGEFAVDAAIPPRRIFGGQAHDQGTQVGRDGRSTWTGRCRCPAPGDELAMPAQDGGRGDERAEAAGRGEQSGERGDQGAVGPAHPRARGAPSEHGELVTQDQDLDLLTGLGSSPQHDPAQERGEHLVDQPQRHRRIMPAARNRRSTRSGNVGRVSGTHTLRSRVGRSTAVREVRAPTGPGRGIHLSLSVIAERFTTSRHDRSTGPVTTARTPRSHGGEVHVLDPCRQRLGECPAARCIRHLTEGISRVNSVWTSQLEGTRTMLVRLAEYPGHSGGHSR
jgi:hypothetical protein